MLKACPLCCVIPLTHDKVALVDPEIWVSINRRGWKAKKSRGGWYAYKPIDKHGKTSYVYLHRLIAQPPPGFVTHHKNKNTLDDRALNFHNMTQDRHKQLHKMLRIAKTHGTR